MGAAAPSRAASPLSGAPFPAARSASAWSCGRAPPNALTLRGARPAPLPPDFHGDRALSLCLVSALASRCMPAHACADPCLQTRSVKDTPLRRQGPQYALAQSIAVASQPWVRRTAAAQRAGGGGRRACACAAWCACAARARRPTRSSASTARSRRRRAPAGPRRAPPCSRRQPDPISVTCARRQVHRSSAPRPTPARPCQCN
jgi:hypothetical protein